MIITLDLVIGRAIIPAVNRTAGTVALSAGIIICRLATGKENKPMGERQRINVDIQKLLWRETSVIAARLGINKRDFVEAALQEKIEKEKKKL